MTDQGKANYEGYYAAMPGSSPVPFDELPHAERLRWDAGACSVELWLAEAPADEDMPGNEPQAVLDAAYRERAHLVAHLAARYPSSIGTDPAEPDWRVVYVQLPTGQVSWHISRADSDLINFLLPDGTKWDGHDTAEKYRRLDNHTQMLCEDSEPARPQESGQYALVELMGHAQVTGSWRETVLCGRPMLEITRLDAAERRVQLVGPESVYRLTPLTEAEAMHVTRYARAAITAPAVRDDDDAWLGDEDDGSGL
jgi:hypothetical protein